MKLKDYMIKFRKTEKILFFVTILGWFMIVAWDAMENIAVMSVAMISAYVIPAILSGIHSKIVPAEYEENEYTRWNEYEFISTVVSSLISVMCFMFIAYAFHYGESTYISNRMATVDKDIKSYDDKERSIQHVTTVSECKAIEMQGQWPLYWMNGEFETLKLNQCKSLDK